MNYTEQQKQNLSNVLRLAKDYIAEDKKKAVEDNDFDTSLRLARNEAQIEAYFRERGIEPDP